MSQILPYICDFCVLCSKLSLLTSRWDRSFFFIQGGNLMNQSKDEVSHCVLASLLICTVLLCYVLSAQLRHLLDFASGSKTARRGPRWKTCSSWRSAFISVNYKMHQLFYTTS